MLLKDAYLLMFTILNDYYDKHREIDSLASLLSDMDPNIFKDGHPADPATYNDWKMIVSPFVKNGNIERKDVPLALKSFLIYYQQEFGYDLESIIADINSTLYLI